jgi:enoyl-CoA hydratase/carnithine racemase
VSYEYITFEKDDHVGILTLNRPRKMNSLSQELLAELRDCLDAVQQDKEVRVLVLTGAGDVAFSTGFDLGGDPVDRGTDEYREHIKRNYDTFMRIWNLRIPSIAAVNGYAVAGGSNLAMICDIVVAAERAKFGEPEIRHYALSPLLLLPWFNGNPRMVHYLYYSGDTITADEALEYGLVAKVVPNEDLLSEAMRMAHRIALVAPYAVEVTKDSVRRTYEIMGFSNALEYHRINDTTVITATGIPDKDKYREARQAGGLRKFLELRDGPFEEG